MQANFSCFLLLWVKTGIVYDWLQTTGKLHQKSGGTPKKETVSCHFFCSSNSRTIHPCTIRYSKHGQHTLWLLHPYRCQRAYWAPLLMLGRWTLSSIPISSQWCRRTNSMVCLVRTQTHISNTSSNCATQLSSRMLHLRALGSACFPSPSWGRQNSGFTKKRKLLSHETNVPWRSLPNFSPWAKLMS
jgi:hypothetical protein